MSFIDELQRRNVIRVGIAYAAVAWLLAQVADLAFGAFDAPDWALRALLIALAVGFPIALGIAWVYELTPDGVRVDDDGVSDASPGAERKLDRIIIGVLAAAMTILLVERFYISQSVEVTQSIAVLPFVNMSDDNDHFADGLSEELLNVIARIPDLKVAGRTSSFEFKGRNEDLREIGDALGVEHLLEGSVRRSGDELRITTQLIKVDDGFHLWSQTYDRQLIDVFDIQEDVAREIANALEIRLVPDANRPTENVEAYALYLEALAMSDFPDGVVDGAIDLLDRAIEIDPDFARAHLLKAMAYWQAAGWTMETGIAQRLVFQSATTALSINPDLEIARPFVVSANPAGMSWVDYIAALERAVAIEPDSFRLLDMMSSTFLSTGYYEESLAFARKMVELEPLSSYSQDRVGFALSALGRRNEAHAAWRRATELGNPHGIGLIAWDHLVADEYEEYLTVSDEWARATGNDFESIRSMLESALDPETGKAFLDDWLRQESVRYASEGDVTASWDIYSWYIYLGYLDDVWSVIESEAEVATSTWRNTDGIRFQGIIFPAAGFRQHPKFVTPELVELWDSRGAPDMCDKIDDKFICN